MLQKMYITPTALVDNVSNLMYVPLNASADPTTIVSSNHVPMNQLYVVSTEAVVGSPLCAAHYALT